MFSLLITEQWSANGLRATGKDPPLLVSETNIDKDCIYSRVTLLTARMEKASYLRTYRT